MIETIAAAIAESAELSEGAEIASEGVSSFEGSISKEEADSILEHMLNEDNYDDIKEIGDAQQVEQYDHFDPDAILEGWLKDDVDNTLNLSDETRPVEHNTFTHENETSAYLVPNTEYTKDGCNYKTDDLGNDYIKDGELIPNNTYKKDGHVYTTDNYGNVILKDGDKVKLGGSYKDVIVPGEGSKKEVHHMPSNDSTDLSLGDGPAIKMDKQDHRQTASCGNSKEAQEYRETQRELVKEGKFREALQMDIDDIREKFGDKYDDAIAEMLEYVNELEKEGKI